MAWLLGEKWPEISKSRKMYTFMCEKLTPFRVLGMILRLASLT